MNSTVNFAQNSRNTLARILAMFVKVYNVCNWQVNLFKFAGTTAEIVYNETGYNEQPDITSKFGAEVWSRI